MQKLFGLVSPILLAACGNLGSSPSTTASAPHPFGPICSSADGDVSLRIYEGHGLLQQLGSPEVRFNCHEMVSLDDAGPATLRWSCDDAGGTGYKAVVYKTGMGSAMEASITKVQGSSTPVVVAKLSCQ